MIFIKSAKFLLTALFFSILIIFQSSNSYAKVILPAKGAINAPANSSTISGKAVVRGWFLDGSGVSKIQVLMNGKTAGTAKYGIVRNDVAKTYPSYKNSKSGYQYTLDTTKLSNGNYTLAVKERGRNGSVKTISNRIKIYNPVHTIHTVSVNEVASLMQRISGVTATVDGGNISIDYIGLAIGTWGGPGNNTIILTARGVKSNIPLCADFVSAVTGVDPGGVVGALFSVTGGFDNMRVGNVTIGWDATGSNIVAKW